MTVLSRLFRQTPPALVPQPETSAADIASSGADESSRLAAIDTLEYGEALLALAGLNGNQDAAIAIRRSAQQRIGALLDAGAVSLAELGPAATNTMALFASIAHTKKAAIQSEAVAALEDESQLAELAIHGSSPLIRQLAAEQVRDPVLLASLLKAARGKDNNVYRIIKTKRDALHAEQRAAAEALANAATLCATIERHSYQPFTATYQAAVDHLARQWQEAVRHAPGELSQRADMALKRCHEVIAYHLQQVANAAAHAAAVENTATERKAILQQMQALLADVYSAPALDVAALVASHTARWSELSAITAPARHERVSFAGFCSAITALDSFNAQHGSVQTLAASLTEESLRPLNQALSHVALLGDPVPPSVHAATEMIHAWEQARAAQYDALATAQRQIVILLRKAQSALAAGHSRQAAGMRHSIESKLHVLSVVPPHFASQLQVFDAQLGLLQDWRSFVVAPKRIELIEQMEAMVGADEKPQLLADQIKRLQEEWKLISKGSTEDTEAEWQRFHEAAQKAYEPCREHFAVLAAQRAANLEKRAALLARLQAFAAAQIWEQTDWREVARALRESRQQWRNHQPVERSANKPLQDAFDALTADLHSRLNAEYARNTELKRALITRAQQLAAVEDARQATDEVKRLQAAWKDIGLVAHEDSQKLWDDFRQYCDELFTRRHSQQEQIASQLADSKVRAVALCNEVEQIAQLSGPELIDGIKKLPALRDAFSAIGELPRNDSFALRTRFDQALQRSDRQLAQQRERDKARAWDHVFAAGERIRLYRWALAETAAPEICDARRGEAQAFIEGVTQWPKGALLKVNAILASEGSRDLTVNVAALRTLCIRAELITDTPTPDSDHAFRREYQMKQLTKGLGQARASGKEEFEAMVFEWIGVGATDDAIHAELFQRFRRCWR
jgi:hypothetical protein